MLSTYFAQITYMIKAVCHCLDDRKINNWQVHQVPKANFSITQGEPKVYTKTSDHGNVRALPYCPQALCSVSKLKQLIQAVGSGDSLALLRELWHNTLPVRRHPDDEG